MKDNKIWYVKFPTYQYKENVKQTAKEHNLKIVDYKFKGKNKQCVKAPKLTSILETDKE